MKILAIIHKSDDYYCYDILYKPNIIERIALKFVRNMCSKLNCDLELEPRFPEYKCGCVYVKEYVNKGWIHYASGDTNHIEDVLKDMGLTSENDLQGLIKYLKTRYNARIEIIKE